MELIWIAFTFIATIAGLAASYVTLRSYLEGNTLLGPVKVKRIEDPDADQGLLEDFYRLCGQELPEVAEASTLEDLQEELEFTRYARKDSENGWDIFHYVAVCESKVLGALSFEYYFRERICYVNYLIIDRQDQLARSDSGRIALALIKEFKGLLSRMSRSAVKNADYILFDLDPSASYRAKCRHFAKIIRNASRRAYKIQFRFFQPTYPRNGKFKEPLERQLVIVPINANLEEKVLSRNQLTEILRFIYLRFYGAHQLSSEQETKAFQAHLQELLSEAASRIPEEVALDELYPKHYRKPGVSGFAYKPETKTS